MGFEVSKLYASPSICLSTACRSQCDAPSHGGQCPAVMFISSPFKIVSRPPVKCFLNENCLDHVFLHNTSTVMEIVS